MKQLKGRLGSRFILIGCQLSLFIVPHYQPVTSNCIAAVLMKRDPKKVGAGVAALLNPTFAAVIGANDATLVADDPSSFGVDKAHTEKGFEKIQRDPLPSSPRVLGSQ